MDEGRSSGSFGCEYCASEENRLFGHVPQIGSNALQHLIVMRCPKCGAFYSNTPDGDDQTQRLKETAALRLMDNPPTSL